MNHMNALLIIKTANGYAVMPYSEPVPQADLTQLHVATKLNGSFYSSREKTVAEIMEAHFEPPAVELKEAA